MNKPSKKWKLGGVDVAMWKKETDKGTMTSYSIQKSYKDKDGSWQHTSFLNDNELLKLSKIINTIFTEAIQTNSVVKDMETPF